MVCWPVSGGVFIFHSSVISGILKQTKKKRQRKQLSSEILKPQTCLSGFVMQLCSVIQSSIQQPSHTHGARTVPGLASDLQRPARPEWSLPFWYFVE